MAEEYCFFFSYDGEDHKTANRSAPTEHNMLDGFYDQVVRIVSSKLGVVAPKMAAYRDCERLHLSDKWPEKLPEAMNVCRTLIAIITPRYLQNHNCGREFKFFMDRYDELKRATPENPSLPYPIIPLFWEDSIACHHHMPEPMKQFFRDVHFTAEGFPANYPSVGLRSIFANSDRGELERICDAIANRIFQCHAEQNLPKHPASLPFAQLPSMYENKSLAQCICEPTVSSGIGTTQVVYIVGNMEEMKSTGIEDVSRYSEKPEGWKPFSDAPGATVEAATEEGLRCIPTESCNWGWPQDLIKKIDEAEQKNSPVLLVLDRDALRVERCKTVMQQYDSRNYFNSGLVTAGGSLTDDCVRALLGHRFGCAPQSHIWTISSGRTHFVEEVQRVVKHLKNTLLLRKTTGFAPSVLPSLRGA